MLKAKRAMKSILFSLVFLVFATYWTITCFFNFPESSVVIGENYRGYQIFNTLLFQKWSFFAPPPTYNTRMHYIYTSPRGFYDVEVFEQLNKKLTDTYLSNDMYSNISYMLFANVDAITGFVGRYQKQLSKQANCGDKDSICNATQFIKARSKAQESRNMKIIIHHAMTLAKSLNLGEDYNVQVLLSNVDMPKYADRNRAKKVCKENLLFATSQYNSISKQWKD